MGLPVVATRHAGIADVVDDEKTGFLVEERDIHTMAKYMLMLANDPYLAEMLEIEGRNRVKSFYSIHKSIDNLANILKKNFFKMYKNFFF